MADGPTVGSVLAAVVPVVVGGLLTLAGGAGMQWYLHREKTVEERRLRRAAKLEELVAAIYDLHHWLSMECNRVVFGTPSDETPSPLGKVQGITALYFPEFADQVRALERGADKYEAWIFDRGQARLRGEIDQLRDGNIEAYSDYSRVRIQLLHELQEAALKIL